MTEFGRGSFGERVVMTCQVCMNPHHEGQKEVFVQDRQTGAYKKAICPLCMCLDCVQTHDDPIRAKVRPLMMGQTLQSQYNLTIDEFDKAKGHTAPVRRQLSIKAPGPLNMQEVLAQMGGLLGLQPPASAPKHNIGQAIACGCGKNATSKCIACELPLCMKCLKSHDCDEG
jgi:hypothetical protein